MGVNKTKILESQNQQGPHSMLPFMVFCLDVFNF
jgi:hypothetical protein